MGYWLTKAYSIDLSKEILLTLLNDVKVVDIDPEDAIQYYTALYHKVDFFISDDKKLQRQAFPSLPIYSIESFLKMFS